jgi:hypothetical protein
VPPTIPPTGADANKFLLGVRSERRAARRHQPDRKRNRAGRVPMVGWFVAACDGHWFLANCKDSF